MRCNTDIVCISPIDGREVAPSIPLTARRPRIDAADRGGARERAGATWRAVPLAERAREDAGAFLDALLAMNQEVVPELALQMGRPVRYRRRVPRRRGARALHDAHRRGGLKPIPAENEKAGFRRMIEREPVGVVLVVAPWNYPYLTAVNTIVPALMAGNAVLAEACRADAARRRALPDGGGPRRTAEGTVPEPRAHPRPDGRILGAGLVDHCNFTGSVAGGRAIERAAAGTFTSLGLELGGKDPAYVRADANLDHAIENLVDGAFFNSGQCCCGIERIYVHEMPSTTASSRAPSRW